MVMAKLKMKLKFDDVIANFKGRRWWMADGGRWMVDSGDVGSWQLAVGSGLIDSGLGC